MPTHLVITALGTDRAGIVNELSDTLFSNQLNIEDSRMSILGGEFAILLLSSGTEKAIESFVERIAEIEAGLQMSIQVKLTESPSDTSHLDMYEVDVVAIDNPGIVHNLAGFFSSRQINIVELETDHYAAPHTGTPIFSLHMAIGIPKDTAIANLRAEFATTCDDLNLDATLSAAD